VINDIKAVTAVVDVVAWAYLVPEQVCTLETFSFEFSCAAADVVEL
jgi:hypothetical protein